MALRRGEIYLAKSLLWLQATLFYNYLAHRMYHANVITISILANYDLDAR